VQEERDVLEKAGVDAATAFTDLASFKATPQAIKAKVPGIKPFGVPGKKAFDLVHNVMPSCGTTAARSSPATRRSPPSTPPSRRPAWRSWPA
jgi:hypothetical protein